VQIVFSKVVQHFDVSDLRLTRDGGPDLLTGTEALSSGDGQIWNLGGLGALTTPEGSYTLTVLVSDITDLVGNPLSGPNAATWVMDTTAPTADVTDVTPDPRNAPVTTLVFVFNEPVQNFVAGDITLTLNGGANLLTGSEPLTSSDGVTWILNNVGGLTGAEGSYQVALAPSSITDLAGNPLGAGASDSWVLDTTAPTVTVGSVSPNPRNAPVPSLSIVLSEAMQPLNVADMTLSLDGGPNLLTGTESLTTSDNITWTLDTSGLTAAEGQYVFAVNTPNVADVAGNMLAAPGAMSWTMDVTPPTVDVTDVVPDPRNTPVNSVEIVFSEKVVNFGFANLSLTRNGGANLLTGTEALSTGDNISWMLDTSALTSPQGTYTLAVSVSGIVDTAGNALAGPATDTWVMDLSALTATIERLGNNPTGADFVDFKVTFSAPVAPTFTTADVTLNGTLGASAAVALTNTDPVYTVRVTMGDANADGTIGITIPANVVWTPANNRYPGGDSEVVNIYNWRGFKQHPESAKVYTGDLHNLLVQADCDSPVMSYQWKWDDGLGKALHDVGVNSSQLLLNNIQQGNRGDYWCEVTYDGATYPSDHAVLSVEDHLLITVPPDGGHERAGASHTFSIQTSGGYSPLSYQWKKGGGNINGATDSQYLLSPVALTDAGDYSVEISDTNGDAVESVPVMLTVSPAVPAAGLVSLAALASILILAGGRKPRKK
jgi:hypothetical protein